MPTMIEQLLTQEVPKPHGHDRDPKDQERLTWSAQNGRSFAVITETHLGCLRLRWRKDMTPMKGRSCRDSKASKRGGREAKSAADAMRPHLIGALADIGVTNPT